MIPQATANRIFNAMSGRTNYSAPSAVYLGYCKTQPNAETGVVSDEPSSTYYARLKVKSSEENYFGTASGGKLTNSMEIRMPVARSDYGTQYYWFLSESASGPAIIFGDLYNKKDGTNGLPLGEETVPVFYAGDLTASIDVAL